MSQDSNTNENVELIGEAERTVKMIVPEAGVNDMLRALGGGNIFPEAADLDRVLIEVDHAPLMNQDAGSLDAIAEKVLSEGSPSKVLPQSPLLDDPAFAALAGEFEGTNRLFNALFALLISRGAVSVDDVLSTVREVKNNFGDMITTANDRNLEADQVTLRRFREFWEMIDADFPSSENNP
jgi:hypothetical protein